MGIPRTTLNIATPAITIPTLIIRAYINGSPINFAVSLFALPPRHVFAVGYSSVTYMKSNKVGPMIITILNNPTWISREIIAINVPSFVTATL